MKQQPDPPFQHAAARAFGRAVAEFRQGLIDGGCPKSVASELTQAYLTTIAWNATQQKPEHDA